MQEVQEKPMYVGGEWILSADEKYLDVKDPSRDVIIARVPRGTKNDVSSAVEAAKAAFDRGGWGKLAPADRSKILLRMADLLELRLPDIARLESVNSGKSIRQTTEYDLPYSIDNIRFLAGASRTLEGKAMAEYVEEGTSAIRREPIGVVGVITPWNYPLMMVIWRAFPALAMGNTVVVKPASYTPLTTLELAKIAEQAGMPKGVLNVVTGPGELVGEALAKHPDVDMIAFTGSTEVGRRLSELGSASLKKVSLELGGKAPFIVFDDSNLEAAAEGAVVAGLVNNGQDCANSTRYYVHEKVYGKFRDLLLAKLSRVRVGDPQDTATDMGPLVSQAQRTRVEGYIKAGIEEGGKLLQGGERPRIAGHENGYFLNPTVISTENDSSKIVMEEIFGPVFTMLKFDDYNDVIARSNSVVYGLGSSVWTSNVTTAMRAVRDLRFGTVWVNEHVPVPSEMPWAGYKKSGHGASLSPYSLDEFTYIKHVYFDISGKERKSWYGQIYSGK